MEDKQVSRWESWRDSFEKHIWDWRIHI